MDDDAAPDDAIRAFTDPDAVDICRQSGMTFGIGDQLRHVATMMVGQLRIAVGFPGRIEMAAGTTAVRRTAVASFVDMETMGSRRQAAYFGDDSQLAADRAKCHLTGNLAPRRRLQCRDSPRRGTGDQAATATGNDADENEKCERNELLHDLAYPLVDCISRTAPATDRCETPVF